MTWRITTVDKADGRHSISSAVDTRDDALRWAGLLHANGIGIVHIKERGGEKIGIDAFYEWLAEDGSARDR